MHYYCDGLINFPAAPIIHVGKGLGLGFRTSHEVTAKLGSKLDLSFKIILLSFVSLPALRVL